MWEIQSLVQLGGAMQAFLLGIIFGAGYAVVRIDRVVFRRKTIFVAVVDVLCFTVAAVCIFCLLLLKTNGQIRVYILLNGALGFLLFFCLTDRITIRFALRLRKLKNKAVKFLKKQYQIIAKIVMQLYLNCKKKLREKKLHKNNEKKAEKHLQG